MILRRLAPGLLLAALCACEGSFSEPPPSACVQDADCVGGFVCALGVCADPDALSAVNLEIQPPESSGLSTQQVFGVVPAEAGRVEVRLQQTVQVSSRVETASGAAAGARIVATPTTSIPGRSINAYAQADSADGTFTLGLVDGLTYRLAVHPDDPGLPPLYSLGAGGAIVAEPGLSLDPIVLPDPAALVAITGRAMAGAGAAVQGIDNLEVRATADGRRVSTVARTDADGFFELRLSPGYDGTALDVEVRSTPDNTGFPTVTLQDVIVLEDTDIGEVELGDVLTPVEVPGLVVGTPGEVPIPGAKVYLRAAVGNGVFTSTIETDAQGAFVARVPPGTYGISAVAPPGSPFGALIGTVLDAPLEAASTTLRVPRRPTLSGRVLDATGAPVAEAGVELTRLPVDPDDATPAELSLDGVSWSFDGQTDAEGRYALDVDPGRYRLGVRPASGTNLPQQSLVVVVDEDGGELDVQLEPGALLAGVVLGADVGGERAPVPGAFVRAFFAAPVPPGESPIPLGDGFSGGDGAFHIVLPDLRATLERPAARGTP